MEACQEIGKHAKVVVYKKVRKFEEIFHPGRRHSKRMQNLRVQSTAENLICFVSLPG